MRVWARALTVAGAILIMSTPAGYAHTQGDRTKALAAGQASGLVAPPDSIGGDPVPLRLRTRTFDPLVTPPPIGSPPGVRNDITSPSLWLVQFTGPIQDGWIRALSAADLEIVGYIPDYAYLVWGTKEATQSLDQAARTRWSGRFMAAYALHPALTSPTDEAHLASVAVQIYNHPGSEASLQAVQALSVTEVQPPEYVGHMINVRVRVSSDQLQAIASLPDVVSVEPLTVPQRCDEIQGQIVAGNLTVDGVQPSGTGYLAWLTNTVGLTITATAYPIIDITDDGIDDGNATPQHPDFYVRGDTANSDRLVYNENWTTDPTADGGGGHGNLNAAIAGGYNARVSDPYADPNGYNLGLGINPFGPIAGSKIFGNESGWAFPSYVAIVSSAYTNGARIISNSWGDTEGDGEYLIDDQTYDALVRDADPASPGEQPVTILFSAGNSGYRGATTIGSPGNAKNVITVGASESYRPTWTDGCNIGPTLADSANDIPGFSSQGPTVDGRVKPDIVAPGTHIQGAASQSPNYQGDYVCDAYRPQGQTLYAASSGTSHATPAAAGAASLVDYVYRSRFGGDSPSPAMAKALLVNSARYLTGVGAGDTLPSFRQGFGALHLGRALDAVPRIVEDQATVLHTTSETYTLAGFVASSADPLRITLAWTDPPGSVVGAAYVNDLDLAVAVGGHTYLGNVFAGAYATTGGAADPRNNVESVYLPSGKVGSLTVTVTATNLAGDGVPDNGDPTDQDFALVCYNCTGQPPLVYRYYFPLYLAVDPAQ